MEKTHLLKRLREVKEEFDLTKQQILQEIKSSEERIKILVEKINSLEKEYYDLVEKIKK